MVGVVSLCGGGGKWGDLPMYLPYWVVVRWGAPDPLFWDFDRIFCQHPVTLRAEFCECDLCRFFSSLLTGKASNRRWVGEKEH